MDDYRCKALQTLTRARFCAIQDLTRKKQRFANYLFLKYSGLAQDKDITNTSVTTIVLMERFETVDELAYADLDELTAFIDEKGRNFADPDAKVKAIQTAARNSFRPPVTANNSVRRCDSKFRRYYNPKYKEVNKHQYKRALALTTKKLVRLVFWPLNDDRLYKLPEG